MNDARVEIAIREAKEHARQFRIGAGITAFILVAILGGMAWIGVTAAWIAATGISLSFFWTAGALADALQRLDARGSYIEQAAADLVHEMETRL